MAITATEISTNRYAPDGCNSVLLFNTGDEGGSGLTLAQLSIAVSMKVASAYERQSVVKMNTMNIDTLKLEAAADWLTIVANGTADYAQAKNFCVTELKIDADTLPYDLDSYNNRMAMAKAMKSKIDALAQAQQEDMIDLQTLINRRDVAYSTSTNIVTAFGSSMQANAANY